MVRIFKIFILLLSLIANKNFGMNFYCDSLSSNSQLVLLDSIITSYKLSECCQNTIEECLKIQPNCMIAHRFYNFSCWMVLRETEFDKVLLQLDKRQDSFLNPQEFSISPTVLKPAGTINAKITITAYISANCSLCKKVVIPLYMAVTSGPIEKKAVLNLKPILPNISNMALLAAQKMGKFWEYYHSLEKEEKRLDEKILVSKAKKLKLPVEEFKKMLYDEESKKIIEGYKAEAIKNGITITPTLFINNRRYSSYKDPQWIIDLVEYEYEKVK